ncbi:hypothetical protein ACFLQ3_01440 [Bacteroidota bacterium]
MEKKKKYMNLDALVVDMELKDNKFKRIFHNFQILYFVLIFIYAGIFLFNPSSEITIYDRVAGGFYVVAFGLFAFYFRKYYKKYKEVNYSDSVKKVLEDAEKRYRIFKADTLVVLIGVLCIDAATVFTKMYDKSFIESVLKVQIMIWPFIIIGVIIGYLWWRRDSRPIWLSAKKLLKELEE